MAYGWRAIAIVLVTQSGCFSDSPTGGGEGTTGGSCSIGSLACDCTDGQACDNGLECHLPSNTCIEADCIPGDGLCRCDGTRCADGFVCVDEYCEPFVPGTSGVTTMGPGPLTNETFPDETFGTTYFTSGVTGFEDVGPPTSTSAITTGTTDYTSTSTMTQCEVCLNNARDDFCSGEFEACNGQCDDVFACFANMDLVACCVDYVPPAEWNAFAMCAEECQDACSAVFACASPR